MVWVRSPVYFYNRNGIYYFSRAVPSDLRHRFPKRKIEVSLRTKSESKAARSAAALSDRLERYWDSLRMEMIYSKELGLMVLPETRAVASDSFSLTDALALYHRLKGTGKTSLFFESSERSIRYLIECLGHDSLTLLEVSDAGRFRDYLFERGMSSSSVKRVFSSVRAVINLAIREHGLSVTNVFSGTFIPDDQVKKKRLPIPSHDLVKIQQECMALDDEPRWLIALISDTGMRLSEACGLQACDIHLGWRHTLHRSCRASLAEAEDHFQQQTGATGRSVTLGSAQDPSNRLYLRLHQILQRSQVQCELRQCGAEQMAETTGARWMRHPLLPSQSARSPPCH
jgi:integrase